MERFFHYKEDFKNTCLKCRIREFTMRSYCSPYKLCKNKKQFLYNPNNSFDVYIGKKS